MGVLISCAFFCRLGVSGKGRMKRSVLFVGLFVFFFCFLGLHIKKDAGLRQSICLSF